jgi:hypothetical protein
MGNEFASWCGRIDLLRKADKLDAAFCLTFSVNRLTF